MAALLFDNFFNGPFVQPRYAYGYGLPTYRAAVDPFFGAYQRQSVFDELFAPRVNPYAAFDRYADDSEEDDVEMSNEEEEEYEIYVPSTTPVASPTAKPSALPAPVGTKKPDDEANAEYIDLTKFDTPASTGPASAAVSTADALAEPKQTTTETPTTVAAVEPTATAVAPKASPSLWSRNRVIDMTSNDTHLVLKADLAGIPKDNVELKLENGYLTLKAHNQAERRNSKGEVVGRQTENISRSFFVGTTVDPATISATYNNGDFQVTIPRPAQPDNRISIH